MRLLSTFVSLVAIVSGVFAQTSPADVLRGPAKKIALTELPANYRAVSFGASELSGMSMYGLMGAGGGEDKAVMLFSLMGTVFVDPDEFASLLNGKLARIQGYTLDLAGLSRRPGINSGMEDVPSPVFSETWIEAGRIVQWTPRPAMNQDSLLKIFGAPGIPSVQNDRTRTLSNAKQAALATVIYQQDYDDTFPSAESTAAAMKVTQPYSKNLDVWKSANPNGGRLLYNTSLSGVNGSSIEQPAATLLIWDEKPWPDGKRVVAYVDGHAKVIDEIDWKSAWQFELLRRSHQRMDAPAKNPKRINAAKRVPAHSKHR